MSHWRTCRSGRVPPVHTLRENVATVLEFLGATGCFLEKRIVESALLRGTEMSGTDPQAEAAGVFWTERRSGGWRRSEWVKTHRRRDSEFRVLAPPAFIHTRELHATDPGHRDLGWPVHLPRCGNAAKRHTALTHYTSLPYSEDCDRRNCAPTRIRISGIGAAERGRATSDGVLHRLRA